MSIHEWSGRDIQFGLKKIAWNLSDSINKLLINIVFLEMLASRHKEIYGN